MKHAEISNFIICLQFVSSKIFGLVHLWDEIGSWFLYHLAEIWGWKFGIFATIFSFTIQQPIDQMLELLIRPMIEACIFLYTLGAMVGAQMKCCLKGKIYNFIKFFFLKIGYFKKQTHQYKHFF